MKKAKLVLFISFFLFLIFLFGVYLQQEIYSPREPGSPKEVLFTIEKGQSAMEIAFNLERKRLIKSAFLFSFYAFSTDVSSKLQAGKYLLFPSMTIPEIARKIASGDTVKEKITIIEGWSLKEISSYLETKGFSSEEFFKAVNEDFSNEFDFLKEKPKNLSLEGYIFPATYEMAEGESVRGIIRKSLETFDKKLNLDLKEEISRQKKTIFEIVVMASLLEKEVKTLEDKKIVSGILWKRLESGIPLQVDATINYITGEKTTKISIAETKIDSPYNTYRYKGLPLGPICNPGIKSIEAAISPQESAFWYYLSTPAGETIFNETLEKHNIAKAKYLQ